jgi:hypothetical protein
LPPLQAFTGSSHDEEAGRTSHHVLQSFLAPESPSLYELWVACEQGSLGLFVSLQLQAGDSQ